MAPELVAAILFLGTYALIASEKIDKTAGALAGGLLMILFGIVDQAQALEAVDFNVIFLLVGMMVIANVLSKTGVFQWLAIKAARLGKGDPFIILLLLSTITAIASAFLPNVTIVVLTAPVAFLIASHLRISPVPFLLTAILASNIGGMATLIGDPPNLMVGSAARLDFVDFLLNVTPITIVIFVIFLATCKFLFARQLDVHDDLRASLKEIEESDLITDRSLLVKASAVLILTIIGFLLQGWLGYEVATVAMVGAVALLIIGKQDPHQLLSEIDWSTLFFFIGLFILVGGLVHAGIIDTLARRALDATQGSLALTSMLVLWLSAVLSGLIDNVPYTAIMIPLIKQLGNVMSTTPLWWSLALGASLGGNATIIGASANLVVANLAARSGVPISFRAYLKYGALVTFESLVLSSIYVWLRYL